MSKIDFEKTNETLRKIGHEIVVSNSEVQTTYTLMKYEPSENIIIKKLAKVFPMLERDVIQSSATLDGLKKNIEKALEENKILLTTRVEGNFIVFGV